MKSTGAATIAIAILCTGQGCAPHVLFPRALPRSAPYVDRLAWYERFHTQERTTLVVYTQNSVAPPIHRSTVDGQQIFYTEDLVPLVGRRSRVARHTRAAIRGEVAGGWALGAGVTSVALGLTTFGLQRSTGASDTVTIGVGATLMSAGTIAALTGWILRHIAAGERGAAYDTFDEDLRRRLGVCLRASGETVDCDQLTPTTTSPTP